MCMLIGGSRAEQVRSRTDLLGYRCYGVDMQPCSGLCKTLLICSCSILSQAR